MGLAERLRNLDSHSTVSNEFRVYTVHGAVLSIVTVGLILYLSVTEAYFNFQVTLKERVHVNATSPAGLQMEFDITLFAVPCSLLNIDANDPTGQSQSLHLDKQHHVWKHRTKMDETTGKVIFIGDRSKLELGSTLLNERELLTDLQDKFPELPNATSSGSNSSSINATSDNDNDPCGSCYGAGDEGECCDTCDDVRRAYKRRGWVLHDIESIKQCAKEAANEGKEADDEGCNVHGIVALSSGGGNLHLAPGRDTSTSAEGTNIFDMLLATFRQWNVSHTVNKIRFGPEYPAAVYQLDGQNRTIVDTYGMYQYYFQIVPTVYKFKNGTVIQTNQYSVTEHLRHVSPGSARGLPGVFFFYEVSPLHVEIVEDYRRGWIAFFTSVCAVVGGVVTVMGMVDQCLFSAKSRDVGGLAR